MHNTSKRTLSIGIGLLICASALSSCYARASTRDHAQPPIALSSYQKHHSGAHGINNPIIIHEPSAPDQRRYNYDNQTATKPDAKKMQRAPNNKQRWSAPALPYKTSTLALDADTASYFHAAAHIRQGTLPDRNKIRIEEFINAGTYHYPHNKEQDLTLNHSIVQTGRQRYLLRIGIQARKMTEQHAKRLCIVIDRSGSMNDEQKLHSCKQTINSIIAHKHPDDEIALVSYASKATYIVPYTRDPDRLTRAVHQIKARGQSNIAAGIIEAFKHAQSRQHSNNSVLLISDGIANQGKRHANDILESVKQAQLKGINLFTLGLGKDAYNDQLMEELANKGNGTYHYIDNNYSYDHQIGAKILNELDIVAFNAKAQISFDPNIVSHFQLVGYNNRTLNNHEFFDRRIDAADIPADQSVTALYSIHTKLPLKQQEIEQIGHIDLRWQQKHLQIDQSASLTLDCDHIHDSIEQADYNTQIAFALSQFAIALQHQSRGDWHGLLRLCDHLQKEYEHRLFAEISGLAIEAAAICQPQRVHHYSKRPRARRW